MAAVEFSVSELRALAGKKFTLAQLREYAEALGMPVESASEDALGIDVTPNRPDMLCIEGFARALAAFTGVRKGLREYGAERSGVAVRIEQSVKSVRPFIVAAVVKGVPAATHASLMQMQEKLHDTLGRRRRKVSIGVHDFAAVHPPLAYKAVPPQSVSFVPLGSSQEMTPAEILQRHPKGVEYAPILAGAAKYPVLCDASGVISLPPIINAERTRVRAATNDLLVEVTGTSLDASHAALKIICASLADRGGRIFSVAVDSMHTPDMNAGSATLDANAANRLLGSDIGIAEMCRLLGRMGYAAVQRGSNISVKVPCYRTDVLAEADLIEDVAIAKGYGEFALSLPSFFTPGVPSAQQERFNALRDVMHGLGFCEALTQTLTSAKRNFEDALLKRSACVTIKNPVGEFTIMRTWLLPSLLGVLAANKHAAMPQRIYELGEAVLLDEKNETGARTETRLCAAITHAKANFSEAKSLLEALLFEAGIAHALKAAEHPSFIAGRAAGITCNGRDVGVIGELHPQALENFALEHPVAAFEILLG